MTADTGVFVVFEEIEARKQHAVLLGNLGLQFQELDVGLEPLSRGRCSRHGAAHLILPNGLGFLVTVRQVRDSFPDAAVLAVGDFSTTERRIHAYMAGADNCLPTQGQLELAAVLLRIGRKGMVRIGTMPVVEVGACSCSTDSGCKSGSAS